MNNSEYTESLNLGKDSSSTCFEQTTSLLDQIQESMNERLKLLNELKSILGIS